MSNEINLSRDDAELIWQALDTARGYHLADDLARQYKNAGGTHRPSNITKRIEHAIQILDQAVVEGEENVAESVPVV